MNVPDPEVMLSSFLNLQREIFVNMAYLFFENVQKKDKNLFDRATDFSKDFNKCEPLELKTLELKPEDYPVFCNYVFDFMNYVRKINKPIFDDSLENARTLMDFKTFPTMHMCVKVCTSAIEGFLEMRDTNKLDEIIEEDDED